MEGTRSPSPGAGAGLAHRRRTDPCLHDVPRPAARISRGLGMFWHAGLDPGARQGGRDRDGPRRSFRRRGTCGRSRGDVADRAHDLLFLGHYNFLGGTQKSAINMITGRRGPPGWDGGASAVPPRRPGRDAAPERRRAPDRRRAWRADRGPRRDAARRETVVATYPPVFDERARPVSAHRPRPSAGGGQPDGRARRRRDRPGLRRRPRARATCAACSARKDPGFPSRSGCAR